MSARFWVVSMQCARKVIVPSLAVVWAASCAVFPDRAVLPAGGTAGAAGHDSAGQAGGGGMEGSVGGMPEKGGAPAHEAGTPGLGGSGAGAEPLGGASPGSAGACATPRQIVLGATADNWIEAAKPTINHGDDPSLLVTADPAAECRALLSFSLPAAPPGATLLRATLTLQLEGNADLGLAERQLELSPLEKTPSEDASTWRNWDGGSNRWGSLGGDFGPAIASITIPALTPMAAVSFDITAALEAAWSMNAVPFPLIVREVGDTPTPAGALAFTSREGDDLVPELLMEYCP